MYNNTKKYNNNTEFIAVHFNFHYIWLHQNPHNTNDWQWKHVCASFASYMALEHSPNKYVDKKQLNVFLII
jgi:hypothetical protein